MNIIQKRLHRLAAAAALAVASLSANAAFDIDVVYSGDASYQQYFTAAESFWESVITGYQAGISITGLTIDASVSAIDGAGGILGQAGPTFGTNQGGYLLVTEGVMQFDVADVAGLVSGGAMTEVIMHEMAHVIGFGTVWDYNGLYNTPGQYTGAAGLAMYQAEFNKPGATFVPVELGGGPGTAGGHWNEVDGGAGATGITDGFGRDMGNELMTGWLNSPTFVSMTTIASFEDLGYTVNFAAVPEPESMMLFALGLPAVLLHLKRRRERRQA